jgi:hypothetical protein
MTNFPHFISLRDCGLRTTKRPRHKGSAICSPTFALSDNDLI